MNVQLASNYLEQIFTKEINKYIFNSFNSFIDSILEINIDYFKNSNEKIFSFEFSYKNGEVETLYYDEVDFKKDHISGYGIISLNSIIGKGCVSDILNNLKEYYLNKNKKPKLKSVFDREF